MLYVNPLTASPVFRGEMGLDTSLRAKTACRELEQYFIYTLLQEMRKSIPEDGLLGSGMTSQLYTEMFDDALSKVIADSGQMGIAAALERQLAEADVQRRLAAQIAGSGL